MPEWSEFWWTSITGPRNLCDAVSRALYNKSNVCLIVPDDLPWHDEMRACIETGIHQLPDMDTFYVEFIDVEDDCSDTTDIGRYLLERYASPMVAAGYRGREKIQNFIRDNHVLDNRILWIKGLQPDREKKWLQFCRDCVPVNDCDGRFVLETRWTDKEYECRNMAVIRYYDMINHYDLSLFNSIYLNKERRTYSPIWQQYAAVVCSLLCNTDAETSQAFMEKCDFSSEEPFSGMRIVAADAMCQRLAENNDAHIISLVCQENMSAINNQIWKAQLQVLFPLIEIERVSFIERYREQIREALSEKYYDFGTKRSQIIYQFGEIINNPNDAELGTIYRMTKLKREADSTQYLLYIPSEQSRSRIELLRDLRNALAHGDSCPFEKVAEFINGHSFVWN